MDIDYEHYTQLLLQQREALLAISESGKQAAKPVELDQASVGRLSRMDAMQLQAMAQATEQRRAEELKRIAAALGRIKTGDYGYCIRCDEAIAPKRLEINPTTLTCIGCSA